MPLLRIPHRGFRQCTATAGDLLTNAADVLSLPADRATTGIPVFVRGVVTTAEPHWDGRFFVQDDTGGVFVENIGKLQPAPGDLVEVYGVTQPGAYAPIISKPHWEKVGTAPLPLARPVPIEQMMSGAEDGQRIEISGVVRAAIITDPTALLDQNLLCMDIVSGGYRLQAYMQPPEHVDPQSYVGARVRLSGTAAASFNATLRRLITTKLFIPLPTDFVVEKSEAVNPFDLPTLALGSIAQYRRNNTPDKRIHVLGRVAYQRPGDDLFLVDTNGGCLRLKSRQHDRLAAGETVEAVGFPDVDHFLPVLQDAVFRKLDRPLAVIKPRPVEAHDIQSGLHHADFVVPRWQTRGPRRAALPLALDRVPVAANRSDCAE